MYYKIGTLAKRFRIFATDHPLLRKTRLFESGSAGSVHHTLLSCPKSQMALQHPPISRHGLRFGGNLRPVQSGNACGIERQNRPETAPADGGNPPARTEAATAWRKTGRRRSVCRTGAGQSGLKASSASAPSFRCRRGMSRSHMRFALRRKTGWKSSATRWNAVWPRSAKSNVCKPT